jgi:hypothetical protein
MAHIHKKKSKLNVSFPFIALEYKIIGFVIGKAIHWYLSLKLDTYWILFLFYCSTTND